MDLRRYAGLNPKAPQSTFLPDSFFRFFEFFSYFGAARENNEKIVKNLESSKVGPYTTHNRHESLS